MVRVKRILWMSRHNPCLGQWRELKRIFGDDVYVYVDKERFDSVEDIRGRYVKGSYDALVLVAPKDVYIQLIQFGICPLRSRIGLCSSGEADIRCLGKPRRQFLKFVCVTGFKLCEEDVDVANLLEGNIYGKG